MSPETKISIGEAEKLSIEKKLVTVTQDGEEVTKEFFYADFEVDGKRFMCNTWRTEMPDQVHSIWVRDLREPKEDDTFKGSDGQDLKSTVGFARYGGVVPLSSTHLIREAAKSGYQGSLGLIN
jgi:hypothetical protein